MALYISIAIFLIAGLLFELASQRKKATYTYENSISNRENKHTRVQIVFFFVVIFVLWFLTAFRSKNIGNDTETYLGYFQFFAKHGVDPNGRLEMGYQILNVLVSKISNNPQFFFAFVATFCYVGTGIYIYKYSDNLVFSTVLLFPVAYSFFASGLRQAIAMVICLYAYQAIKKKKLLIAILLILFAFTFHKSALVMLVLLLHKFIPKKLLIVLTLTGVFIALSLSGIMDNFFADAFESSYGGYYGNDDLTDGWLAITYYCLRNLVFYILVQTSFKRKQKENSLAISLFAMLLITASFGFSLNLFNRATNYFLLISVIELPNSIYRGRIGGKKTLTFLIGFIMVLYFLVVLITRPEWNHLYPYELSWN